ncbi:homoserine kinase [Pseudopedobacter saltans DSM 12145]|uniref:Homoserine kinase n=1 Tax=Pseudopedobacter saltans (strain ATCC 51119 / DSM 12145 / JCM 21818 / CCUG 39354 / LMG 10337 / NBRC 100064 / NCIMB 13643) TaxID=762903 RepID=F0SDE9_PSESL|nr:homoserine kinase [Pseudopedobacter saltans]ADY53932.1 homoserine kinase [Pseudopedobacter saltans DSM 12145]
MSKRSIRVFSPATVANVVCGFDILGFAVNEPGDELYMELCDEPGVVIASIEGDEGKLPLDPDKNTVSACVKSILRHLGKEDLGVKLKLTKKMPLGSGLGSSSASAVAGIFAINELLGRPLTKHELLPFAMEGEALACGHGHADNVAPALFGGFTLIKSYEPLEVIQLPVPDLYCALLYPHVDVPTRDARQIIRSKVALKDAVVQWGNIAGLVSALYQHDYDLLGRSMKDVIVEPVRSILIPEFDSMKQQALANGALGFGISGSGPTVFSLYRNKEDAEKVLNQLKAFLKEKGIESNIYLSKVNSEGPVVLE